MISSFPESDSESKSSVDELSIDESDPDEEECSVILGVSVPSRCEESKFCILSAGISLDCKLVVIL